MMVTFPAARCITSEKDFQIGEWKVSVNSWVLSMPLHLHWGTRIGNMFQSNQAYVQLNNVTGGALDGLGWLVGLVMAAIVFSVIIGGIKSIARVTEKVVPFMAIFYCVFAIVVILMNFTAIPQAISNIFTGAFTGAGVAGGAIGALIIGFQRAVFSNEAGIGSASIAHSAVKTNEPVTEELFPCLSLLLTQSLFVQLQHW